MKTRREFVNITIRFLMLLSGFLGLATRKIGVAYAEIKMRILPKNTEPSLLHEENPEYLDTRNLRTMPVERFGTMGDTDQSVNLESWRLEIIDSKKTLLEFSYDDLLAMPALHKKVLLICPGFFSYHAKWTGVSILELMKRAQVPDTTKRLVVYGLSSYGERKQVFQKSEFASDEVFLAYRVNDQKLPKKHGFPIRIVAEGHWGSEWVKYVNKLEFDSG
jgi:sulfoxide reductase catalytic subunit YedY